MAKVLIVGSGGREHALGWKLGQSPEVSQVWYAPGNAGTQEGKGRNVAIDATKESGFPVLEDFISEECIDLTVIGPEAPLTLGLTDYLERSGHRVFGPSMSASLLESDKFFSYDLMKSLGIPQAQSIKCYSTQEAIDAIKARPFPGIVIKARGLTGGKGVTVCNDEDHALEEITSHAKAYGEQVLIAEKLIGEEFSVFGISDGNYVSVLEMAVQDHKRLNDGDKGPNTGGMGAYCPAPVVSTEAIHQISESILTPLVQKMKDDGMEYKGFIYAGMMKTNRGVKVLEFNIRFGDPECQPAMMLLRSDLYEAMTNALDGKLRNFEFNPGSSCCVVLASQGYPGAITKDLPITGLDKVDDMPGIKVFHAGTAYKDGRLVSSGGRVLGVASYSSQSLGDAWWQAYDAVDRISVPGGFHYRRDIGAKGL